MLSINRCLNTLISFSKYVEKKQHIATQNIISIITEPSDSCPITNIFDIHTILNELLCKMFT